MEEVLSSIVKVTTSLNLQGADTTKGCFLNQKFHKAKGRPASFFSFLFFGWNQKREAELSSFVAP